MRLSNLSFCGVNRREPMLNKTKSTNNKILMAKTAGNGAAMGSAYVTPESLSK